VAVDRVENLRCLLRVLGEPTRGLFETRLGYVILPQDRIADHDASGAVACHFCPALQHRAAKIGEGTDKCGVGCAVRAGLGVVAPSAKHRETREQSRLPQRAATASRQGYWPVCRVSRLGAT
jgi:hypothetical protein